MNRVFIVLKITDFSISQKVEVDRVFDNRKAANKYMNDKNKAATSCWYKIIGKGLISE